ncbi:cation:proton antiporter family protein [Colwellia sp. BRX9-1]|uniref:cation:proton antiporter family protein n=1 Tax=Colwellia sp. BRX9-1 TaxID=2759830 RepID=UPI0015F5EC53|nr:cation:proton antiporter family protein [Colwellia sp. BRX9-1]MBA6352003.1 cation:proton antiporter [Colwellia sp. BRX9-1]
MDFIWILFAFGCGMAAKSFSLPPSIGYLFAGFLLNFLGFQADDSINTLANLGITLMLFTIGLKLNVKDLLKKEVWLGSLSHSVTWVLIGALLLKLLALAAIGYFADLSFYTLGLIIFALSFSSTVCVVKLMEDHGEMRTRHGKLAVGILVIQDIVAVIFLVVATGKSPTLWALLLLSAFFIKPLINKLIDQVGHGELIPLTGFFLAFGAYELFELVSIKGDLGALLVGMYLASHSKASEINKSLMGFKDLFLIGFFLSIGFTALPTVEMLAMAGLLTLLIPVKFFLFFFLFTQFKLRGRTSYLTALALSNFSEFGLIIASLSTKNGWLTNDWLVILSLAVSLSFIITNITYNFAHRIFTRHKSFICKYERKSKLSEDNFIQPCDAPIVVIGMGRVGMGAYKALDSQATGQVWGLDADQGKIAWLNDNDVQAFCGDAENIDFWENIEIEKLELILLALPKIQDIKNITLQLRHANYQGQIAAIARFDDERQEIETFGVDKVFNFYTEAGVGFAEESLAMIKPNKQ